MIIINKMINELTEERKRVFNELFCFEEYKDFLTMNKLTSTFKNLQLFKIDCLDYVLKNIK